MHAVIENVCKKNLLFIYITNKEINVSLKKPNPTQGIFDRRTDSGYKTDHIAVMIGRETFTKNFRYLFKIETDLLKRTIHRETKL